MTLILYYLVDCQSRVIFVKAFWALLRHDAQERGGAG